MVEEVKEYLMAFGTARNRAEEMIEELVNKNELEEFYNNMYIK